MKINKIKEAFPARDTILLGDKTSDFSAWLETQEEKDYVKNQLEKEKTHISLDRLSYKLFIQLTSKKEDKTQHDKLEWLRKEGAKYKTNFDSNDITSIQVVEVDITAALMFAFLEGLSLSHYQFLKYFKEKDKKAHKLETINVYAESFSDEDIASLNIVTKAVFKTRDLVNEPLSYLTAVQFSKEIEAMGKESGFSVEVLTKKKIESLKMGGLLAVNKGSIDPPTFSILEHKPSRSKNKKPYVLVGKGVVYDTGGLSLKPTADSMDYMKSDMAGAAAVAGAMYAIAAANLPVHVIALIPATDNRPDGNAYVPGDVIKMYDKTTVEVLNTDAEGRMILADALAWAKQYEPELVIDLATLTGAAWVAIGTQGMVGMGNAPKKIMEDLKESGFEVHERIAEFPFWDDYSELLKSDVADLKNIGGRLAGAITAGKFLEHFTDYPYIHLDIAGPAFLKKKESYRSKGGSGVGVRLLYNFFKKLTS
ncbi:MAG: leucyl aminopeptidase family protein [Bacteroidales bacterium]